MKCSEEIAFDFMEEIHAIHHHPEKGLYGVFWGELQDSLTEAIDQHAKEVEAKVWETIISGKRPARRNLTYRVGEDTAHTYQLGWEDANEMMLIIAKQALRNLNKEGK